MQARLIAYPDDAAAMVRWVVPGETLRIGRAHECGLLLDDPSVSRAHAELAFEQGQWQVRDLGSKNGTFVDGVRVDQGALPPAAWLRVGDVHVEFAALDDAQAGALREREAMRRARSQVLTRQVAREAGLDTLLGDVLRGVLDLSGCERAWVLDTDACVRAALRSDALPPETVFAGSTGALQRVLADGRALVSNAMEAEPWLASRHSVATGRIASLLCLPLLDGERLRGLIYADRRGLGEPITEFDLDLLRAFAETATLSLIAHDALGALRDAPRWGTLALPGAPDA